MSIARRFLRIGMLLLVVFLGLSGVTIAAVETRWFKDWLRGYIAREAHQFLNGDLTIGRLHGNLFFNVTLDELAVSMDGADVVRVADLSLNYNVFELITSGIALDEIRLTRPIVHMRRVGDSWSLARIVKEQEAEADREGPASPISIGAIVLTDGQFVVEDHVDAGGVNIPRRVDQIDARLSFAYEPVHYSIDIEHLRLHATDPDLTLEELSGGVAVRDASVFLDKLVIRTPRSSMTLDGAVEQYLTAPVAKLQVSSPKLSLPEISRFVPALANVDVEPTFEIKADGPLERLGLDLRLSSNAGNATATVVAGLTGPRKSLAGDIAFERLNLAPILGRPDLASDLSSTIKADVQAAIESREAFGTLELQAPALTAAGYRIDGLTAKAALLGREATIDARTGAYGAAATAVGTIGWSADASDVSYDLRGTARKLNVARLPRTLNAPAIGTDINADYRARGTNDAVKASATFQPSTVDTVRVRRGSVISVDRTGRVIAYAAKIGVSEINPRRLGRTFNVPALDQERYEGRINAQVEASGRGTDPRRMTLEARGTLTDSQIAGASIPQLSFDAGLENDTLRVTAAGRVNELDPAVLASRDTLAGRVDGVLDVDATIAHVSQGVTADGVEASVYAELDPSQIGTIELMVARLNAHYAENTATVTELLVDGSDVHVEAGGSVEIGPDGASQLAFSADSTDLSTIAGAFGVDLAGIGKADGIIQGNRGTLTASGQLTADGLKYGETQALTIVSDYQVTLPELDVERVQAVTDSRATFIRVGGQEINEFQGKVTYGQRQVEFDATAKQPNRSLTAAGSVRLLPEQQEVRLESLALQTQNASWQMPAGAVAEVDYGGSSLAVRNLALESGDQKIVVEGGLGQADQKLSATLTNVELANVDALLLREPQFSGRLNVTAVATGALNNPAVDADVLVEQGGFRDFKYERLEGAFDYNGSAVTLDARLQQNADAYVTAKGVVPRAAFAATDADAPADAGAGIDVTVESSQIDLGVVQGFTTAVTDVTGALQANLRVTGSPKNPDATGAVTISNGALTVAQTGVKYTALNGQLDIRDGRVDITNLRVQDDDKDELAVTGQIAIAERRIGDLSGHVVARDFDVLDNEMGRLRVNVDVNLIGQLTQMGVWGEIGVTTGRIDLDPILASVGSSAYDVKQTEYATTARPDANGRIDPAVPDAAVAAPSESDEKKEEAAPSFFDSLQLGVELSVPNDLVIRGQNLKTPGSSIGLGAMNLTLGGRLWLQKTPYDIMRLSGTVNTVRGNYDFQDRRFEILRDGTVRFDGLDDIDPSLNLRARRVISGVEAFVTVQGTVSEPRLVLSSVPPLEQADILALVVFNRPLNELGEGQQVSLQDRATAMASGALAEQLAGSIGRALNLDTFEISTAPETGGDVQFTAGQQIGQRAYIKLQQGLGDQTQSNVIFEYEFLEWLRLQSNFLVGAAIQQSLFNRMQGSGADLVVVFPRVR